MLVVNKTPKFVKPSRIRSCITSLKTGGFIKEAGFNGVDFVNNSVTLMITVPAELLTKKPRKPKRK